MADRKPLSKRVRFDVFKRDNFICCYCGRHPPDVKLECDHIVPVAEGGVDDTDNLVTSCFDCNRGKADIPLSVVPKSLAEKAAETAEIEEQLAGYRAVMQARADRIEDDVWAVVEVLFPPLPTDNGKLTIRRDWFASIKKFVELMPLHEILEAAEIAYAKGPFRDKGRFLYFCKVCWNKIKGESGGQN